MAGKRVYAEVFWRSPGIRPIFISKNEATLSLCLCVNISGLRIKYNVVLELLSLLQ